MGQKTVDGTDHTPPEFNPKRQKKIPPPSESAVKTSKRSVPQLSEFEKGEIIMAHQLGLRPSAIAARICCSRPTVVRWIERWENDGTVERRGGSGRTRVTLPGDDRFIKIVSSKDRWLTAKNIVPMVTDSNGAPKASVWTIRRRSLSFGLFARRPRKKPLPV